MRGLPAPRGGGERKRVGTREQVASDRLGLQGKTGVRGQGEKVPESRAAESLVQPHSWAAGEGPEGRPCGQWVTRQLKLHSVRVRTGRWFPRRAEAVFGAFTVGGVEPITPQA